MNFAGIVDEAYEPFTLPVRVGDCWLVKMGDYFFSAQINAENGPGRWQIRTLREPTALHVIPVSALVRRMSRAEAENYR